MRLFIRIISTREGCLYEAATSHTKLFSKMCCTLEGKQDMFDKINTLIEEFREVGVFHGS